jgi:hypothetical protein
MVHVCDRMLDSEHLLWISDIIEGLADPPRSDQVSIVPKAVTLEMRHCGRGLPVVYNYQDHVEGFVSAAAKLTALRTLTLILHSEPEKRLAVYAARELDHVPGSDPKASSDLGYPEEGLSGLTFRPAEGEQDTE